VLIFLFLKGLGTNKFEIPIYYTDGVPSQQRFDCVYPEGEYRINWPADFNLQTPAALFVGADTFDRNMLRRIGRNHETGVQVYLLDTVETRVEGITMEQRSKDQIIKLLHCTFASDTTGQWILIDDEQRIRGYYNTSLEEQDRLLNEISILMSN
jgi:hypothetical protein